MTDTRKETTLHNTLILKNLLKANQTINYSGSTKSKATPNDTPNPSLFKTRSAEVRQGMTQSQINSAEKLNENNSFAAP